MQKIGILFILVMFSLLAKSQDSTDYTLNNIKKYATHIEESFSIISSNKEADKHQAAVQQAENIKAYIDSVEEEMQYLPDDYYYRLSPLVSSYHTDVDEFEKLLLNKDFQDKDKYLANALAGLQQRKKEFRKALNIAYNTALHLPSSPENQPENEVAEENTKPDIRQQNAINDTVAANGSSVVLVEAVAPYEITTSNNALLLDTIHEAQYQIEQNLNSIHLAMQKNDVGKIGLYANSISKASLKISDLALLLKTEQKQNLFILATGLKNLSKTLQELSYKGVAAQDEIQEYIDNIAIKFSTLSTGINLVQ